MVKKAPKVRKKMVLDKMLHGRKKPAAAVESPEARTARLAKFKSPASTSTARPPALGSDPFNGWQSERQRTTPAPLPPATPPAHGLIPVHARLEATIMRRIDSLAKAIDLRRGYGKSTRSEALRHALVAGLDALEAKEKAGAST